MALTTQERVTFRFSLSSLIKRVYLVGDFNQWQVGADPMSKMPDGSFRRTKKLPSGRYEYKFYADGIYLEDLEARVQTINALGTRNSVLTVG
jgi:hypothetical protein